MEPTLSHPPVPLYAPATVGLGSWPTGTAALPGAYGWPPPVPAPLRALGPGRSDQRCVLSAAMALTWLQSIPSQEPAGEQTRGLTLPPGFRLHRYWSDTDRATAAGLVDAALKRVFTLPRDVLEVHLVTSERDRSTSSRTVSVSILWHGRTGTFRIASPGVCVDELDPHAHLQGPVAAFMLLHEVEAQINRLLRALSAEFGRRDDRPDEAMLAPAPTPCWARPALTHGWRWRRFTRR